jgi:hypothetical protein
MASRAVELLVGLVTPLRISCRIYLLKKLKQYGVDVAAIPPKGLQEIVEDAIKTGKLVHKYAGQLDSGKYQTIVHNVEGAALNLASAMGVPFDNYMVSQETIERWRSMFLKHGETPPF